MKSTTEDITINRPADEKPLISIIIPLYNAENYISFCLESIIKQTYSNIEIIVVNDGSTDNSLNIAKEYSNKDKRILIVNKENEGVSAARNRGIVEARGAYICFADADDWMHLSMIEQLYDLLEKTHADISVCNICRTNEEILPDTQKKTREKTYDRESYLKRFFKIGSNETVYYCCNKLYKREIVDNDFFPAFKIGEDVVSSFKAINRSNVIATTEASLYYYRQGSGITAAFNDNYFQLTKVWDEVIELAKKEEKEVLEWAIINRARINFTLLTQIALEGAHDDEKYSEQINELLSALKKEKRMLLKADIDIKRKAGIVLICGNYNIIARLMGVIIRRKQ